MNNTGGPRGYHLQAQIALERMELALAMRDLRDAATPLGIARSVGNTVLTSMTWHRAATAAPTGVALIGPAVVALLPLLRRRLVSASSTRTMVVGAVLLTASFVTWRMTRR